MADIDAVFRASARTFYEEIANAQERAHIDDAVSLIRLDPSLTTT
jgi:hypothetical protein